MCLFHSKICYDRLLSVTEVGLRVKNGLTINIYICEVGTSFNLNLIMINSHYINEKTIINIMLGLPKNITKLYGKNVQKEWD